MDNHKEINYRKLIFKAGCACNCGRRWPPTDDLKPINDISPTDIDDLTSVTSGSYSNSPDNCDDVIMIGQFEIRGDPEPCCCRCAQNRPQRMNWSFTNAQYREIIRENEILLKKIMMNSKVRSLKKLTNDMRNLQSSASVNRIKMQQQIERDNHVSTVAVLCETLTRLSLTAIMTILILWEQ